MYYCINVPRTLPTMLPGNPSMLAENFEKLFRKKIEDTSKAAKAARAALGW